MTITFISLSGYTYEALEKSIENNKEILNELENLTIEEGKTEISKIKNEVKKLEKVRSKKSFPFPTKLFFGVIILLWFMYIVYLYISFVAYIKRLHDLDKSGWWALIQLIPFINIWLIIYCGFFRWTPWKNRFWDNPLWNLIPESSK